MVMYDPTSDYGWQGFDWNNALSWLDSPVGQKQAQDQPMSYYTGWLGERGFGGTDNRSTVARGLFGRLSDAYGAAQLKNPELDWVNFMKTIDMPTIMAGMSPQERGENKSNYAPMDVRWIPR